ncbi:MAG: nucleotidyltransferase domain-containing protein [Flavobacterium sp.]|nr:MAG: nucleotidyltransferase domain-containing protein [Flavobacterium sp.]
MRQDIIAKLSDVETQKQVKVVHAVESGSHAWGFASPDSDYDIRFIYKNPAEWYISLWEKPDVIEFMTKEDFDGSGWDLAKALKLLSKSNAPLIEWLFSPVVYQTNNQFLKQMQEFAIECFSPVATLHHYLGTTKNFLEVCEAENVKLKSYFYALRTALAGRWIIENGTFPPVEFSELVLIAPKQVKDKAEELIAIKAIEIEKYMHPNEPVITEYLLETIEFNQKYATGLQSGKKLSKELEEFFRKEISK